jgi:hypothetical protein
MNALQSLPPRPRSPARRPRFAPARHGASPGRVALATATLFACLAALVTLTSLRAELATRVRSPLAAKLADSERVLYYVLETDAGPRFRVSPSDRSLKLITHLLLPAGTPYDPEAEYAYGVVVIVRSLAGAELWRQTIDLRAGQSKGGGERWGWRHENAFLLADARQLTDDRLTRIRLPPSQEDRYVELRLGAREPTFGVAGLARIYTRRARSVDERSLQERSLGEAAGRELIDRLTYRGWAQLSDDERRVRLAHVWQRLAAEGEPGRDYAILGVYETDYRQPRSAGDSLPPVEVDRWRSLAYNVVGPAELILHTPSGTAAAETLELSRLGLDGRTHDYPRSAATTRRVQVPAGIHTLFIAAHRRTAVELTVVEAEAGRVAWIEASRPRIVDEHGHEQLRPDRRQVEVVELGPRSPAAPRWAIAGPVDAASRSFRFDVRVVAHVAATWWQGEGPAPALDLCFLAADGRELGCERWQGQASVGSAFDGIRPASPLGFDPGAAPGLGSLPRSLTGDPWAPEPELPSRWFVVSEPQAVRVIAPQEAASVELRRPADVDMRLLVRGYGYWPELDTVLAAPFDEHSSARVRWRYPPLDARTWFPLRPINYPELERGGAIARLLAQVRLEPRATLLAQLLAQGADHPGWSRWLSGDPDFDDRRMNALAGADGWDPGPWVSLQPWGRHARRTVLERLDDDAARRLRRRWDPSLFTRLSPGRSVRVDLSGGPRIGTGLPTLHWRVDPRALGRALSLSVDERRLERTLTASRGRWRLRAERTGDAPATVELGFDGPGRGSFWINRPIVSGPAVVARRRTLHELRRSLRFGLRKPGVAPLTVNVVVYVPRSRERVDLRVLIDRGQPDRRSGVVAGISSPSRRFTITREGAIDERGRIVDVRAPTSVVDLAGGGPSLDVVTVPVTLGEDLPAGSHTIRVELLSTSDAKDPEAGAGADADAGGRGRVWLRAFHRGVTVRSRTPASWTERAQEAR